MIKIEKEGEIKWKWVADKQHKSLSKTARGELLAVVDDNGIRTFGDVVISVDRPGREYATLEDIEKIGGEILIPRQVANILGCTPYAINCQVEIDPKKLGFPVIKIGNRVKIPKAGFLDFFRGKKVKEE